MGRALSTTSLVIALSLEPGSWTLLSPVHPLTAPHLREAYQRANLTIGAIFHMRCRRVGPGTRADLEGRVFQAERHRKSILRVGSEA